MTDEELAELQRQLMEHQERVRLHQGHIDRLRYIIRQENERRFEERAKEFDAQWNSQ